MLKDKNVVFKDYFYKSIKLQKHKIYEAELIQPAGLAIALKNFCTTYNRTKALFNYLPFKIDQELILKVTP